MMNFSFFSQYSIWGTEQVFVNTVMFTSVTAGNKTNIYFLDKLSGFLGQFNVIWLYNKTK